MLTRLCLCQLNQINLQDIQRDCTKKERPTTVTVLVDRELRNRLERSAAAHERSLGGEVRALLRLYLSDSAKEEET